VSAADLDNILEFITLLSKDFNQSLELGEEGLMELSDSCDMHHRREGIVGALTAVDMVIRMDTFRAQLTSQKFNRTVGDNLVGVHVGLGARSSLPDDKGEVIIKLS